MAPVARHLLHYTRGGPGPFHNRSAPAIRPTAVTAEDSHLSVLSLCLDPAADHDSGQRTAGYPAIDGGYRP
jgi:hypothetical protein